MTALQKQMPWSATWSIRSPARPCPRHAVEVGNRIRTVDAVPIAGPDDSTAWFSNTFAPSRIGIRRANGAATVPSHRVDNISHASGCRPVPPRRARQRAAAPACSAGQPAQKASKSRTAARAAAAPWLAAPARRCSRWSSSRPGSRAWSYRPTARRCRPWTRGGTACRGAGRSGTPGAHRRARQLLRAGWRAERLVVHCNHRPSATTSGAVSRSGASRAPARPGPRPSRRARRRAPGRRSTAPAPGCPARRTVAAGRAPPARADRRGGWATSPAERGDEGEVVGSRQPGARLDVLHDGPDPAGAEPAREEARRTQVAVLEYQRASVGEHVRLPSLDTVSQPIPLYIPAAPCGPLGRRSKARSQEWSRDRSQRDDRRRGGGRPARSRARSARALRLQRCEHAARRGRRGARRAHRRGRRPPPTSTSPVASAARTSATVPRRSSRPSTRRSTATCTSASWSPCTSRTSRSAGGSASCTPGRRGSQERPRELGRGGGRERDQGRPRGHRPAGRRRLRPRLPRPDAAHHEPHQQGRPYKRGSARSRRRSTARRVRVPGHLHGRRPARPARPVQGGGRPASRRLRGPRPVQGEGGFIPMPETSRAACRRSAPRTASSMWTTRSRRASGARALCGRSSTTTCSRTC